MFCSVSSAMHRASFGANGPISNFHISGGFRLMFGIQETIVIAVVFL